MTKSSNGTNSATVKTSLSYQVKSLQSSVQSWESKLNEMQEFYKSVITEHDSKILKMAKQLKVIRAKLKTRNRRIKELEYKIKVAGIGAEEKEGVVNPSTPICKSSSLDKLKTTKKVEDGEGSEKVPTKAKPNRKHDVSLRRKQKKLEDGRAIIEEVPIEVRNSEDSLSNLYKNQSDVVEKSSVKMEIVAVTTGPVETFQEAEELVNIKRIEGSEISKFTDYSPLKSEHRVDVASLLKRSMNSVIDAGNKNGKGMEEDSKFIEAKWECSICGKTFLSELLMNDHGINAHRSAENSLRCHSCTSPFNGKSDLHRDTECLELQSCSQPTFKCESYDVTFSRQDSLNLHTLLHTRETVFPCSDCNVSCTSKAEALKHLVSDQHQTNTTGRYECPICLRFFKHEKNVETHIERKHGKSNNKKEILKCDSFSESMKTSGSKTKSAEAKANKCQTDEKIPSGAASCKRELNIHLNSKPKPRAIKTKMSRKMSVKSSKSACEDNEGREIRIGNSDVDNSDIKPKKSFQCFICLKFYASQRSLNQHVKIHSKTIQPGGLYRCNFCKDLYSTWLEFEKHVGSHKDLFAQIKILPPLSLLKSSVSKFVCSECSKACDSVDILTVHFAKSHAWKKNYNCLACKKSYCSNEGLKIHCRSHQKAREMDMDSADDDH